MKKLFVLTTASLIAFGASAQYKQQAAPFVQKTRTANVPVDNYKLSALPKMTSGNAAGKTTAANPRWYSPFDAANTVLLSNAMDNNIRVIPIWFDSTIRQNFTSGPGTINYSSVCQVVDPITSQIFNSPSDFGGEMKVNAWDSYKVDSVFITAAYVKMPSRPTGIVDTLVLSVVPMDNITYYLRKAQYANISNYTTRDTLWAMAPTVVDSVNRAAFPPASGGTRAYWKVPLTDADRDTILANGNITLRNRVFAVPGGGLTIPAGQRFAITATFKSGDTWTKNVDSVTMYHRFMPVAGFATGNAAMPYYYYDYTDRSMASLMFASDSSQYSPAVFVETWNTLQFSYEFLSMGGHVVCPGCTQVSVPNKTSFVKSVNAVPNPATSQVNIKFNMFNAADVKVTVTNTMGQVVAAQNIANVSEGTATFSTANLANGVYVYTLEANGQREAGRFVVAH